MPLMIPLLALEAHRFAIRHSMELLNLVFFFFNFSVSPSVFYLVMVLIITEKVASQLV